MANNQNGKVGTRRHRTAERKGSLELHNGKWRIVALVNGEKIRKSTGTADREEAERIQREFMAQFTARDAVAQAEKLADAVKTAEARAEAAAKRAADALPALRIVDATETYLNDSDRKAERPTTESTDANTKKHLRRFCKWMAEHHPDCVEMRQFTESMAREYFSYLRSAVAPGTCLIHTNTLKRVWKVLGEKARCQFDPWAKIKVKQGQSRRKENFTQEQMDSIFSKLELGTELHALCHIGRYTGLRLGDAATLKWSAIDFDSGMIELLPMKVKKYGKVVRIPIHDALRASLLALPKKGEFILPECAALYMKPGTPLTTRISALLESAGIDTNEKVDGYAHAVSRYGFHSFRHSFVSTCAEQGIPLSVVQELVGHLSPEMTAHYFHLNDDAARKAIAALPGGNKANDEKARSAKVEKAARALAGLSRDELAMLRERIDILLA